jgi:hypothetical protein
MKIIQRLIIDKYVTRHGTTHIPKISYDGITGTSQGRPRSLEFLSKVLNTDLSTIYLWRKVVCFVLLCSYEIHWIGMLHILRCLWKVFNKEGCMGLIPWNLDLSCKSSWILIDFFIKKFKRIGMCLWCCWKDLDKEDLMEFIW